MDKISETTSNNSGSFYRRLRLTLDKIHVATALPSRIFIEMLGMSAARYFSIRCGSASPNILELKSLANALDLDVGRIFSGDLDYEALAREFRGERGVLPARYLVPEQQMARARTIKNVYSFLELTRGADYAWSIFRRLQIVPEAFSQPDGFVSSFIIADVLNELAAEGMSDTDFKNLGSHSYVINLGDVNKRLKLTGSPKRLYEVMISCMPQHYDRMNTYALQSLSDEKCVVRVLPKDEFVEVFKSKLLGSKDVCLYKQGVTASFQAALGPRFASVHESSCVYHGDEHCDYHIYW